MGVPVKVALSGSGFRLPAHVGALAALIDHGYDITEIAGTSGGAIVAALFASGMHVSEMRHLALTYDWRKVLMFNPVHGVFKGAYCSGNALMGFLQVQTKGKRFGDLSIPLKIIASDLRTASEICFDARRHPMMEIALAARASASIPLVYAPVDYMSFTLVDGGCCNNLPLDHLSPGGLRIGVYLTSANKPSIGSMGIKDVAERSLDLMLGSNEDTHADLDTLEGGIVVHVPTGYAGSLDREMATETRLRLVTEAYQAVTRRVIRRV